MILTHGLVKKTHKTPPGEIERAEVMRTNKIIYYGGNKT